MNPKPDYRPYIYINKELTKVESITIFPNSKEPLVTIGLEGTLISVLGVSHFDARMRFWIEVEKP